MVFKLGSFCFRIIFILLVLMLLMGNSVYAQNRDSTSKTNETSSKQDKVAPFIEKVFKYAPIPFAGYSTETSTVIGITKYNGFKIKSINLPDSLIQPSSVLLYAYYTLNKQYKLYANIDLMHGDNKYNSKLEILLLDYPSLFFGIGDNTTED
jgi:hypothetical protein